jgi:peroxiredoxin
MCHLQELYAKYKGKGLVILGIDPADDKKLAQELLRENGVTFPNIIDASAAAQHVCDRDYPMSGWPTHYLIDREGKVVDAWSKPGEGFPRAMAALRKLGIESPAAE